ncbi:MAG TPA: glycerophosphodiester phosphodiesterase [Gemmatimonadaceae bacterium]
MPTAISHRGLRTSAPENTIAAFTAAIDAGADAIELDVHSTLDGVVFVHHDPSVPGPDGPVAFRTSDSRHIRSLRIGENHEIPTLDATIESAGSRARLFIEIKPSGIENDVARCLKRHAGMHEKLSVHAFDHRIVKRMIEILPSVRTGILQVGYPIDSRAAMRAAGATDLWQHAEFVDARLVADVHSSGGELIVWTPNTEHQWERLASLGVDGICTDNVDSYIAFRAEMNEERIERHPVNPQMEA